VGAAVVFGLVASSALVLGGAAGAVWRAPRQLTGVLLAFASGSLIAALAFELFEDAVEAGGAVRSAIGLLAGAATFVLVNTLIDSRVASAEAEQSDKVEIGAARGLGFALLAAVTLDGIPENLALGVSLLEGGSLTLLVAIFASNFPEALVGANAMREAGRSKRFAIGLWSVAAVLLAGAVVLGRIALSGVDENTLSLLLAFAGGAVLASLADTLMPEAFEHGRPLNSFATAAGFFVSFLLANA
jgi:ZIP family zinc transporter